MPGGGYILSTACSVPPQMESWKLELTARSSTPNRGGDRRLLELGTTIHDWTYALFPDPDHGEWFGYLHRDGRLSSSAKGNLWKGPFHIPRMQLTCWQLLEQMRQDDVTAQGA